MPVMRQWKLQWWSGSKNSPQNFTRPGYMLPFEGGTRLLREMVTMLRRRDVIHSGPASFWCMIHVPVSVIILVLNKKALLLDLPSYNVAVQQKSNYAVGTYLKWTSSFLKDIRAKGSEYSPIQSLNLAYHIHFLCQ